MYKTFLEVALLHDKESAKDLFECACRTHPIHEVLNNMIRMHVHTLDGVKSTISIYIMCVKLIMLARIIPLCPNILIDLVTQFTVRIFQMSDNMILETIKRCQLQVCRPLIYGFDYSSRTITESVHLIRIEAKVKSWCQLEAKSEDVYDSTCWRIEYIDYIIQIREKLNESSKRLIEKLFYHPFWYECVFLLIGSFYILVNQNVLNSNFTIKTIVWIVIADLAIRSGCFVLRWLRVKIALLYLRKWYKPLTSAQILLNNELIDKSITSYVSCKTTPNKWIRILTWSTEDLVKVVPLYSVFRVYVVLSVFYGLIHLKELYV